MSRVAWLSMTGTALLSLCACHYKGPPVVMRVVEDFFEAFDAPLVVDDVLDAGVVTLTTLGGASSGARATRDGEDVFELIRGSAFVTTDASPNGTTTAGGVLVFAFQTLHVLIGTRGTSYFVEIDPGDADAIRCTVFDGTVYLARRDQSDWPDGSSQVAVNAGETFSIVGTSQPLQEPDLSDVERNEILDQVNEAAAGSRLDFRHVPFVAGLTVAEASALVGEAGLVPVSTGLDDQDVVVGSDPPGGTAVGDGAEVLLLDE